LVKGHARIREIARGTRRMRSRADPSQDDRRCAHQVRLYGMKMRSMMKLLATFLKLRMFTALDLEFESSLETANLYP